MCVGVRAGGGTGSQVGRVRLSVCVRVGVGAGGGTGSQVGRVRLSVCVCV